MQRIDGRSVDELRKTVFIPEFVDYPEGSVLISTGNTRVLCCVTIEDGVPRWMQTQDKIGGWITAEYGMLPRSTHQRKPRETDGLSGRTQEIRRLIGRSLRQALDLEKLGPRTCIIDCDVLQADGGTRTAAITGGYVALALAIKKLARQGILPEDTMKAGVAAISVGIVSGIPMLDLCYQEDSSADVDMNVVMTSGGEFIEVQSSAEGQVFPRTALNQLLDLAQLGIDKLMALQQQAILLKA
jgi:ribonuclease PH